MHLPSFMECLLLCCTTHLKITLVQAILDDPLLNTFRAVLQFEVKLAFVLCHIANEPFHFSL